jgi:hypothetical protein
MSVVCLLFIIIFCFCFCFFLMVFVFGFLVQSFVRNNEDGRQELEKDLVNGVECWKVFSRVLVLQGIDGGNHGHNPWCEQGFQRVPKFDAQEFPRNQPIRQGIVAFSVLSDYQE